MKKVMVIALLGTLFLGTAAFAADAVDGSWKLNVAKSKFSGAAAWAARVLRGRRRHDP
jgi:hypothetical protein